MAALLIGLSVMAVLMGAALPVWSQQMKREREAELIWRGQQYARAVGLFQRKYANTFPPTIDVLVEQRFLRKKYKDPITNEDFQPIPAGGGVPGQGQPAGPPGQAPQNRGPLAGINMQGGSQGGSAARSITQGGVTTSTFTPIGPSTVGGFVQGQGPGPSIGIQGVVSKSKDSSIKVYNGRTKYNEWAFVYMATAQGIMPPGQQGGFPGGTQRPGFNPQGQQPGGRPPIPFPTGPGGSQPSPFAPPSPMGQPSPFGNPRPPARPPG